MSKQHLINRLKWYYPLELTHAVLTFPGIMVYLALTNPLRDIVFLLYGLSVCIFILLQGQHYWKLKLYRLTGKHFNQNDQLRLFRQAKKINTILIWLMPPVIGVQLIIKDLSFIADQLFIWAIVANCFAILEHINYYSTQLMVDNNADFQYIIKNKRFKTASLKKDLAEGKF